MSLSYTQYKTAMATLMAVSSESETNFVAILPSIIAYAEDRIYQELDLIKQVTEGTVDLVNGTRTAAVPSSIRIVHSAAVITPAATLPAAGTRNPLQRTSLEFINWTWPVATTKGVPAFYSMLDDSTVVLAPTPDAAYKLALVGPVRPSRLSSGNPNTFITDNMESLFIAASMVFASGYQKNFGAQADDPKMAQSWELQYQTLKASAEVEEARRKAQSVQWQAFAPAPLAKESRT